MGGSVLNDSRLARINALALQCHAGALSIGFEAFQAWSLALLKPVLRFDGAIWGVIGDPRSAAGRRLQSTHLHRIDASVVEQFEPLRPEDFPAARATARVRNVCLADPAWEGARHEALRAHGQRFGLMNTVSARVADSHAPGQQFVLLARKAAAHRFSAEEAALFEALVPHLTQAHATARKLFLHSPRIGERRAAEVAVALVDRIGVIHDEHVRFAPMLQREWSDWKGQRLPEPLLDLTARHAGTPWQFLGSQVTADFMPVHDLYLVTARPRHRADALTKRESEVAYQYAAGSSFREIAGALGLAPATVRSHLRNVFSKVQVRNKSQLATALRAGPL
jgi:DNA-binding CsgD family transcriptional regulator